MSDETHAEIVAEMRALSNSISDGIIAINGRQIADRFEAAYKREIEATDAKCCQLGRLAGYGASEIKHQQELDDCTKPAVDTKFELCKYPERVLKIGRDYQNKDGYRGAHYDTVKLLCDTIEYQREQLKAKTEVGNVAKLREAVVEIIDYLEPIRKWTAPSKENHTKLTALFAAVDTVYTKAKAAVAEPPRNCDVYNNGSCRMAYHLHGDGLMTMQAFADWLFAPATEKEGGNNAD